MNMNTTTITSTTDMSSSSTKGRVVVRGRYLVYENDPTLRFRMRGMAFPVPLHYQEKEYEYDEAAWIDVLQQLRKASPYINTLRLYRLPPDLLPSSSSSSSTVSAQQQQQHVTQENKGTTTTATKRNGFFQAAADLGFYLIVPLTDVSGDGVLNRGLAAPACYPYKLYRYGTKLLDSIQQYDNVLAGVIGNEVMNNLLHWQAAPCLKAYARDLKRYMAGKEHHDDENRHKIPLMYTTQHDGIGAAISPAEQALLIHNYMTCSHDGNVDDDDDGDDVDCGREDNCEQKDDATIDMFGINIESWCSSLQSYESNEDGSVGAFLDLHQYLENATVPIVFSEMGCDRFLFDRDNGMRSELATSQGSRTWNEVPVVEQDMDDVWSGFVAYAYDGPSGFCMTEGGPWDESHVLEFNQDMKNFLEQLERVGMESMDFANVTTRMLLGRTPTTSCTDVRERLARACKLKLMDVNDIPSFYSMSPFFASVISWIHQHISGLDSDHGGSPAVMIHQGRSSAIRLDSSKFYLGVATFGTISFMIYWIAAWHRKKSVAYHRFIHEKRPNYNTFD